MCDGYTFQKAFRIALVVGTMLNIINQGDFIIHMQFEKINYFKFILTYLIPFFVSTYTAININMNPKVGGKLIIPATLTCKGCNASVHVEKNTPIPQCSHCKNATQWKIK